MAELETLYIEHAEIRFNNFSGIEKNFNPAGKRNFCVMLDKDTAERLVDQGWNVRFLPALDDEDPRAYIQVSLGYPEDYPNLWPKVVLINSFGKRELTQDQLAILDQSISNFENVDVVIRPRSWEFNGKHGVKAMLKSIYVTVKEDEFELKYAGLPDVPDSATNTMTFEQVRKAE